jgi:acetyl esterase/lipase
MPQARRRAVLGAALALGAAACARPDAQPTTDVSPGDPVRLTYGDDPSQFAELSWPDGASGPVGVVVLVHGGFWQAAYGLEYAQPLAPSLLERGWATLVIEYRRVGDGGGYPATLDDVAAAVDLLAGAPPPDGVSVDHDRVVAVGHSAGGHLAAWLATRGGQDAGNPGADPAVPVTAVVSQAGVLDLAAAAADGLGGEAVQSLLGGEPDEVPAAYAVADPTARVPLGVPVLCVHGTDDTLVPISQSETFAQVAGAAGDDVEVRPVQGDHFAVIDPGDPSWTDTLDWIDALG